MIEAIPRELAARANPAKAPDMQAYMKSEMPFLGVQKSGRTKIARQVFAAYPLAGFEAWRDAVLEPWHGARFREERYLAIALARYPRYRRHRTPATLPLYEELIVTGAWWDFVDEVAVRLVGDHRAGAAQGAHRPRAAVRLHRAQSRRSRVLHPQSDRVGAAGVCLGRIPARSSATARRTS